MNEGYFCVFPPRFSHSPVKKYEGITHYVFQFELGRGTESNSDFSANRHKNDVLLAAFFTEMGEIISHLLIDASIAGAVTSEFPVAYDDENTRRKLIIEQMVNDFYLDGLTYEDLMFEMSLSRRQCIRIVESLTGMTLHGLIIRQRLGRAMELMKKTDVPLDEIAYSVGYSSYTVAFRKLYEISPQEYRHEFE